MDEQIVITVDPDTGALHLKVNGPLTVAVIADAQLALMHALKAEPSRRIVLDLGDEAGADHAAVQLLLATAEAMRSAAGVEPPVPPDSPPLH